MGGIRVLVSNESSELSPVVGVGVEKDAPIELIKGRKEHDGGPRELA